MTEDDRSGAFKGPRKLCFSLPSKQRHLENTLKVKGNDKLDHVNCANIWSWTLDIFLEECLVDNHPTNNKCNLTLEDGHWTGRYLQFFIPPLEAVKANSTIDRNQTTSSLFWQVLVMRRLAVALRSQLTSAVHQASASLLTTRPGSQMLSMLRISVIFITMYLIRCLGVNLPTRSFRSLYLRYVCFNSKAKHCV